MNQAAVDGIIVIMVQFMLYIYKMSYNKYTYIGQHIGDNVDHYSGSGSKWKNVIKNDFSNIKKEILKTVYSNIDANIYEYTDGTSTVELRITDKAFEITITK